jgi:hypothetical protein
MSCASPHKFFSPFDERLLECEYCKGQPGLSNFPFPFDLFAGAHWGSVRSMMAGGRLRLMSFSSKGKGKLKRPGCPLQCSHSSKRSSKGEKFSSQSAQGRLCASIPPLSSTCLAHKDEA